MTNDKPFVQAALFADKVLREADGTISIIRMVDRFTIQQPLPDPEKGQIGALDTTLLVSLKSGDVSGEHTVAMRHRSPTGNESIVREWPVVLKGNEHGFNIIAHMTFAVQEFGLHWFDVIWEGDVLTSAPMLLIDGTKTDDESSD